MTADMPAEGNRSGSYEPGILYPKVQVVTVVKLLEGRRFPACPTPGKRPKMPTPILPYVKARARRPDELFPGRSKCEHTSVRA